jgi:aminopeptidase N
MLLFMLAASFASAQQQQTLEMFKQQAFNPEYDWQSKYLFEYNVHFYWLDISVNPLSTYINGNVTIGATTLVDKLDTFAVELIPEMAIDSAFMNGAKLDKPVRNADNVLFPISEIQGKGSPFSVKIYYHGTSPTGGFFSGVSTAYNKTWDKHVAWTLSEPFAAKTWFPVKQDLKDKADSAWIFLTVDSNYMAGSEGLLTRVVDLGNGKKRYEWKTRYPIDYYLLSYAVADYRDFSFYAHPDNPTGDSVLVQNYIYNSDEYLLQNKSRIKRTGDFIDLYVKLFGPYPFRKEKYGQCLTELHGGMEHQTMTTLGNFGFDLVAHELGHMWFGDNVTCADWSDIWVNEGFATYADYLSNEYILGDSIAKIFILKAQKSAMSQPGGTVFVPEDQIYMGNEWRIFNGRLSYDKGAAIIHMLRHEIDNDSVFFRILKTYQVRFAGSTATGDDFKSVVNDVTGKDYTWFFKQWYYGEGYPLYSIEWYDSANTVHVSSTQSTSTDNPGFFKMWMDYEFQFENGHDTLIRLQQTTNVNHYEITLPGKVKGIVLDPNAWTLEKISKVDYVGVQNRKNPAYFNMGPVPAQRVLYLSFDHPANEPKKIWVTDISGRIVLKATTRLQSFSINTSRFRKGLYLVRVETSGHIFVRKFIH